MLSMMRVLGYVMCLLVLLFLTGCGQCKSKMREFNVEVVLLEGLEDQAVKLDLVGVANRERWEGKPMTEYWSEGPEGLRGSRDHLLYKLTFEPGSGDTKASFSKSDPIWKTWKEAGAWHLFILAYISGQDHQNLGGEADSWRAILPLDRCRWDRSAGLIRIELTTDGVFVPTRPLDGPR